MEILANVFRNPGSASALGLLEEKNQSDARQEQVAAQDTVSISPAARERLQAAEAGEAGDSAEDRGSGLLSAGMGGQGAGGTSEVERLRKQIREVQQQIAEVTKKLADATGKAQQEDTEQAVLEGSRVPNGQPGNEEGRSPRNDPDGADGNRPTGTGTAQEEVKTLQNELTQLTRQLLELNQQLLEATKDG